jgi:hypothetical protein
MSRAQPAIPVEDFVKAICTQLDRVQVMLAMKAKAGMPLSFAVRDVSLQLRTHLEAHGPEIRIRCAGPEDAQASTLAFTFASITRPAMMENTEGILEDSDEPQLEEVLGDDFSDDERKRLEWAGIRSVRQLREVERRTGRASLGAVTRLPVDRLRAALERASRPLIDRVLPMPPRPGDAPGAPPVLRVAGRNLLRDGASPAVTVDGRRAAVLKSSERELLVAPVAAAAMGVLTVETAPGAVAEARYESRTEPADTPVHPASQERDHAS